MDVAEKMRGEWMGVHIGFQDTIFHAVIAHVSFLSTLNTPQTLATKPLPRVVSVLTSIVVMYFFTITFQMFVFLF